MSNHVYIARQPILNRSRQVIAYELLFRASDEDGTALDASDRASAHVFTNAVHSFGFEALTQGKLAFINATRSFLLSGIPEVLPPSRVVIELLETIEADDEVLDACRRLRRSGYAIALDDFVLTERTAELMPLADYVKVDVLAASDPASRYRILERCRGTKTKLLAEKVETVEQFDVALSEGFTCFQGFFFGRPVTQGARAVPGDRLGHLRLLSLLQDPDLTVSKLEGLISHDPSLCYRLLRTVNSAAYACPTQVGSIRQALVRMGIDTVRRWASLLVLAGLGRNAAPELVVMSTVRGRCCELLALTGDRAGSSAQGFLLGLCSLLDAILERPMEAVVEHLPLSAETRAALTGEDNHSRLLLDCTVAHERGDWSSSLALGERAGIEPAALARAYQDALRWSADFHTAA